MLTRCQVIQSCEGGDTIPTVAPSVMSATVTRQYPAERRPLEPRTLRHCRICDARFEDYDEIYGRVIQFCCFCGDRLVRAMLGNGKHRVRPVNISSVRVRRTPDWYSMNLGSRSPTPCGGLLDQRSRSPNSRVRVDSLQRPRSPLSSSGGANDQCLLNHEDVSNSQRDQLQNLVHGGTPLSMSDKKVKMKAKHRQRRVKRKMEFNKEMKNEQDQEKSDATERLAKDTHPQFGESQAQFAHPQPTEATHVIQAISPLLTKTRTLRPYQPTRELSYSPHEFHATIAKLRREQSQAAVQAAEQQRQVENHQIDLRRREEELKNEAKKLREKIQQKRVRKTSVIIDLTLEDD